MLRVIAELGGMPVLSNSRERDCPGRGRAGQAGSVSCHSWGRLRSAGGSWASAAGRCGPEEWAVEEESGGGSPCAGPAPAKAESRRARAGVGLGRARQGMQGAPEHALLPPSNSSQRKCQHCLPQMDVLTISIPLKKTVFQGL